MTCSVIDSSLNNTSHSEPIRDKCYHHYPGRFCNLGEKMAEKRMFSKKITSTDIFLDMPVSAQNLYFHLNVEADDDGFIGKPKAIMRSVKASDDDLKVLLAKRYVLGFESGVIVIKHWRIHNILRKDRYTPTTYVEELNTLTIDEKGSYTENFSELATKRQPSGNPV